MNTRRHIARLAMGLLSLALALTLGPLAQGPAQAVSSNIVISQVYGGGGNSGATYTHDFIELFNRGTTTLSLSDWSVQYTSATGTGNFGSATNLITPLSGSLAPGQYLLIQEAQGSGGTTPLPTPDVTDSTPIGMSATGGKVALVNTTTPLGCNGSSTPCSPAALATIVDLVGYGNANFYEGAGATPAPGNTTSVIRAGNGCVDTDDNSADFAVGAANPRNTASPLNSCPSGDVAPSVSGTTPADGATNVAVVADIDISFSEPVDVSGNWFTIACSVSGSHTAVVSGGPTTFTLNPDVDFTTGETCTVTVYAAQVTDQDTNDPPDNMAADFAFSFSTGVPTLVVNEIDYDQPGTDAAEFIEIKNVGGAPADLSQASIELVNGASGGASVYQTIPLPAVNLAPGAYFVVCGDAANVPNCDLDVSPDTNLIQNGAPDGVGLRLAGNLVDAVSYEGDTGAPYTEGSGAGLLDDPDFTGAGISRCPDGSDTDQNNVDFSLHAITPGAANACLPAVVINEIDYDQPSTDTAEFVEIRNNDIFSFDLSSFSLELVNGDAGGAVVYRTFTLNTVSLAPGDYYVVCANNATVANCDQDVSPDTNLIQNGSPDAVGLRYNGLLIDTVSYEGDTGSPYTEGSGTGLEDTAASAQSISRCPDGSDTNQNNVDFSLRSITPGAANFCVNDVAPTVASTNPPDGAPDAALNTNINVNFSEDVTVSGSWYSIYCTSSGAHTAAVSGGPQNYTLDPDVNFANGESCTVTVFAANVTDQDGTPDHMTSDYSWGFTPVDVCTLAYTPIYTIQGSGSAAAITGLVTTQGVVVGDYEGPSPALRGFYLQDLNGDSDPATSDGIFVFNGSNNSVNLGDVVRVTGSAEEFEDQTEIGSVTSIANCGTGSVSPVDVTLPFSSTDYPERYEGMLIRLPQTLYVTEHFQLGRFGQIVMSSGDRLQQPTNVVSPGPAVQALQDANDLNRIIIDDELNNQNPDPIRFGRGGDPLSASNTLRGGDTATGIVGVMVYDWAGDSASGNAYRVRPINALGGGVPDFQPANPRPATPEDVGGTLKVVGMNLLNFFNTFDGLPDTVDNCTNGVGGTPTDCRGADTASEFDRQWPKTVAAILGMDADVIGVVEMENDGYGLDSAIQFLVDKLNAATAPGTYAFIDVDAATGQVNALGTDAIKVGLIYKPAKVTPAGTTAVLNSTDFVNGGDSDARNRPSLAQAFEQNANGQRFVVDVNHLKSKGSACDAPDAGDGQGNCNSVRTNAANLLADWLASDPTGTGDPDVLILGDLNSYAREDPITALINGDFTNLIDSFIGSDAYSYVFDGQWGYLDHALGSSSIVPQVTGVTEWHINADEPSVLDYNTDFKSAGQISSLYAPDQYRISDHDPVIVGLCQAPSLSVSVSPDSLWPPNHKYVTVHATVNTSSDTASVALLSVTSNEPDNGLGDGDTPNDIVILDDYTFNLRAERSGTGSGRVYTITYQATNTCGNSAQATATVTVPHDRGKP